MGGRTTGRSRVSLGHRKALAVGMTCKGTIYIYIYYESQPVGLAEVISASEVSLGGPGGRASQMCKNRVK